VPCECFHSHKTISIFGRCGTGKTSFLLTLLHRIRTEGKPKRIHPLNPIDPNMIEVPEIFLATVVTAINKEIMKKQLSWKGKMGRNGPRRFVSFRTNCCMNSNKAALPSKPTRPQTGAPAQLAAWKTTPFSAGIRPWWMKLRYARLS